MTLISPLDLRQHLVVGVAGNPEVFSFLAILLISIVMGKYQLPNKVALAFYALFGVIMSSYIGGLYVVIILIGGIATFYSLTKIVR